MTKTSKEKKAEQPVEFQTENLQLTDVLTTEKERLIRKEALYYALVLGANYDRKARLTILADGITQTIESIVWALTQKNVNLKNGMVIPVETVLNVELL